MALPPKKPAPTIPIEVPADLQPTYANLARIAHAPAEFVIDFARLLPGDGKALVAARVIMSPGGPEAVRPGSQREPGALRGHFWNGQSSHWWSIPGRFALRTSAPAKATPGST